MAGATWYPVLIYSPVSQTLTPVNIALPNASAVRATAEQVNQWISSLQNYDLNGLFGSKSYQTIFAHDYSAVSSVQAYVTKTATEGYVLTTEELATMAKSVLSATTPPTGTTPPSTAQTFWNTYFATLPDALKNALLGGGFLPSGPGAPSWLDSLIVNIGKLIAPVAQAIGSVGSAINQFNVWVGQITQIITTTFNDARALGTWIDSPATLERIAAVIIGAVLAWIGVNVFITSFVDVEAVGRVAALAAA